MRLLISCPSCERLFDFNWADPGATESRINRQYKKLLARGEHARVVIDKDGAIPADCRCVCTTFAVEVTPLSNPL